MKRYLAVAAIVALGLPATRVGHAADVPLSPARAMHDAGMVDIRTLSPMLREDMKYAGSDNFTGAPVEGYGAPRCFLRAAAAEALSRVETSLHAQGYALQVWDCYRPARAVAAFVRWADDLSDTATRATHYPKLGKDKLLGEYIAPVSGHSRGATVDLTLLDCRPGRCKPLDMGTGFDFFDPLAHTDDPHVTPAQRANRQRLLKAMAAQGFVNYAAEWWHYTLPAAAATTLFDVPIN